MTGAELTTYLLDGAAWFTIGLALGIGGRWMRARKVIQLHPPKSAAPRHPSRTARSPR